MIIIERVLSGLIVGLIFGFLLQRGRFCFNSAFRDIILFKDTMIVKAIWVAVVIEMVGFALLTDLGVIFPYPRGFYWGANMLGGFVFGVGMVIAGGCISGATYRAGEGMVGSMLALVGIAVGGSITIGYWLAPFKDQLQAATKIELLGQAPTIPALLGVNHWLIIAPVAVVSLFLALKVYRRTGPTRVALLGAGWPWWLSGICLGLVATMSYPAVEMVGGTYPLGMTGGYIGLLATIVSLDTRYVGWEVAMVVAAIIGSGIAAVLAREWRIRVPRGRLLAQSLLGGLMMGVGAVLGDGCNIATVLIGVPLLSIGSMTAALFTVLGCWTTAYLMFR